MEIVSKLGSFLNSLIISWKSLRWYPPCSLGDITVDTEKGAHSTKRLAASSAGQSTTTITVSLFSFPLSLLSLTGHMEQTGKYKKTNERKYGTSSVYTRTTSDAHPGDNEWHAHRQTKVASKIPIGKEREIEREELDSIHHFPSECFPVLLLQQYCCGAGPGLSPFQINDLRGKALKVMGIWILQSSPCTKRHSK